MTFPVHPRSALVPWPGLPWPALCLLLVAVSAGGIDCAQSPASGASYACQSFPTDAALAACVGGPPPLRGGQPPDLDRLFPLGCSATSISGAGASNGSSVSRTCICEATAIMVGGASPPIWVCRP